MCSSQVRKAFRNLEPLETIRFQSLQALSWCPCAHNLARQQLTTRTCQIVLARIVLKSSVLRLHCP